MRATLAYTSLRLVLFIVSLVLVYLVGARGFLLVALALSISGVVSLVVLSRHRDAMSGSLVRSFRSFHDRLDAGTKAEDQD
jgi:hypothetical protein